VKFSARGQTNKTHIDLHGSQRSYLFTGRHIAEANVNFRRNLLQPRNDPRYQIKGVKTKPDTEASDITTRDALSPFQELIRCANQISCFVQNISADIRKSRSISSTLEERTTDFRFKLADPLGQRRLT
jgi:hypothetical protein